MTAPSATTSRGTERARSGLGIMCVGLPATSTTSRWNGDDRRRFGATPGGADRRYRAPDAACSMSDTTAAGCET